MSDRIAKTDFATRLLKDCAEPGSILLGSSEYQAWKLNPVGPQPPLSFKPKEQYALQVIRVYSSLTECVQRAEEAVYFLRVYPQPKAMTAAGINRPRWIEYHLSQFVYSCVSCEDTCQLLVNEVLLLGLLPRFCNDNTITKNRRLIDTPLKAALQELGKVVKPYRKLRNDDIHSGTRPKLAEFLENPSIDAVLSMVHMPGLLDHDEELRAQVKDLLTSASTDLADELQLRLQGLVATIEAVLAALLSDYKAVYGSKITYQEQFEKIRAKVKKGEETGDWSSLGQFDDES
jgi:hypothetical protein